VTSDLTSVADFRLGREFIFISDRVSRVTEGLERAARHPSHCAAGRILGGNCDISADG